MLWVMRAVVSASAKATNATTRESGSICTNVGGTVPETGFL